MICWELFWGFLRVGCLAFGGAYGAIPLIREVVLSYGWLEEEALTAMIAVSESTPGPIMVNLATYVGSSQGGFWGAVTATAAVVLPSFLIILLVTAALNAALKNRYVQAALRGLKPCIIGIVLATGVYMTGKSCLGASPGPVWDWGALLTAGVLLGVCLFCRLGRKKPASPIALLLLSAVLGAAVYGV